MMNQNEMMRQLQARMQKIQDELASTTVEGTRWRRRRYRRLLQGSAWAPLRPRSSR